LISFIRSVDYLSKHHPAEVGLLSVLTECVRTETQSIPMGLHAHGLNVYEENIHKVIMDTCIDLYMYSNDVPIQMEECNHSYIHKLIKLFLLMVLIVP
jgi:hypothetical protein